MKNQDQQINHYQIVIEIESKTQTPLSTSLDLMFALDKAIKSGHMEGYQVGVQSWNDTKDAAVLTWLHHNEAEQPDTPTQAPAPEPETPAAPLCPTDGCTGHLLDSKELCKIHGTPYFTCDVCGFSTCKTELDRSAAEA